MDGGAAAPIGASGIDARWAWREARQWALVLGLMLLITGATFGPSTSHYFIADDLTNLHFVRGYEGSWLDFWIPGEAYSAPVTRSRYMPLHIWYWGALDFAFGDAVWAYHLLSFLLHALVATLVVGVARRLLTLPWGAALAAGMFFAAYRLHTQQVVWASANFRILSTGLFVAALLLVTSPKRGARLAAAAAFFLALFMNPDFVVAPAIFTSFALGFWRQGERVPAKQLAAATVWSGAMVLLFGIANAISRRSFPDDLAFAPWPDVGRFAVFMLNLVVPFALPVWLKLLSILGLAAVVVAFPRKHTAALALAAATSGAFWSISNYSLAPRYLYVPAIFVVLLTTQTVWAALQRLTKSTGARPVWATAATTAAVVANVVAVRVTDLVHLEYLAVLPQQLADISRVEQDARVYVPKNPLPQADLAFFEPAIAFVHDPRQATHVVAPDVSRYERLLGQGFDRDYWHLPWFALALR